MNTSQSSSPDIVITAGGTRENIDDVRYVGNFSGGKFGHSLATTYSELGYRVRLLAPNNVVDRFGLPDGVAHEPFTSTASLRERLLSVPSARLVLHAAAVADYIPVRAEGKLSSDEGELVIRMMRAPKILPMLRDHFSERASIVGFKLLSNVTEATLIDAATKQIADCRTNACIANDLQELGATRKVHLVNANGEYTTLEGKTITVARDISRHIVVPEVHND